MRRPLLLLALLLLSTALPAAQRRSLQAMQTAAARLLHARAADELPVTLEQTAHYAVIGYRDGGFVVTAASESLPVVVGYSAGRYDRDNENLQWWLRAVSSVSATGVAFRAPTPAESGFPAAVEPLMTTQWDQEYPYNMYCPTAGSTRCLTGCVATAMAQILRYHRAPRHGQGSRTIYYPANNTNGTPVTAHFDDHYYDWDLMADNYKTQTVGEAQRIAVATLMRDCGVASDMQYSPSASGTTLDAAEQGLQHYFGIATARRMDRKDHTEAEWLNAVYGELSQGRPILYGGMDPNPLSGISGHAFVLHGYNEEGLVYVSWGWSGQSDGYYNIALLNPQNMSFSTVQDMVVGIAPTAFVPKEMSCQLTEAGTLSQQLTDDLAGQLTALAVGGPLNADDLATLRRHCGSEGASQIERLDLSGAQLPGDSLPAHGLDGCKALRTLLLPASLKHWGTGALADCWQLTSVVLPDGAECTFSRNGDAIWNLQGDTLIALLPGFTGDLQLPRGTAALADDALAGCRRLEKLLLPASVKHIGHRALSHLRNLTELRTTMKELPTLGTDVFSGLDYEHCQLYVVRGTRELYAQADGWRQFVGTFYDNIVEYGTVIKARNAIREQGQPNPELGYQIQGDYVEGTPELICDATPESPVGRYPIRVLPGTITSEAVDYVDGYLIVTASSGISPVTADAPAAPAYDLSGRKWRQGTTVKVSRGRKSLGK